MKEENDMSILKEFNNTWKQTKNEELHSAVEELRELGDKLEECDPHYFEEEKFLKTVKVARRLAKNLPKII